MLRILSRENLQDPGSPNGPDSPQWREPDVSETALRENADPVRAGRRG